MRDWSQRLRARVGAMLRANLTPPQIAVAVGLGVFLGCLPIYGLHLPLCILMAKRFRLNQAVLYGAANVSNPFFAPFLIAAEVALGEWMRGGPADATGAEAVDGAFWEIAMRAPDLLLSCFLGSLVIGLVLGGVLGGAAFAVTYWRARNAPAHAEG